MGLILFFPQINNNQSITALLYSSKQGFKIIGVEEVIWFEQV